MDRVVFLLLLIISVGHAANILVVIPLPSKSHYTWHKDYLLSLMENGPHNLTVLAHEIDGIQHPNYTVITMEEAGKKVMGSFGLEEMHKSGVWDTMYINYQFELALCDADFKTEGLNTLLNYPKDFKFDLVIFDITVGRCLYPLIDRFGNPPVIATCPFGNHAYLTFPMGNHVFSHIPHFQSEKTHIVTFSNRLNNFLHVHALHLLRRYFQRPEEETRMKEFYGETTRTIDEYERDFSILLVNSNSALNDPESFYPNTIPVGGIHIKPPKKLPKDIQNILDKSEHGVIVVSFGTNLNFETVSERIRTSYLETFAKLKETVLIKAKPFGFKVSKNVIVRDWLPQNDILAHSKVKLLMSHGGMLSTQEAMYHGVPVIIMPFFYDQHLNAGRLEEKKLGKRIKFEDVNSELAHTTVCEVLTNPIYKSNMLDISKKFKDQPETPMQRAIFWTEYVLRNGGASHLNPPSRDFNIIERFDLDIVAFLLGTILVVSFLLYKGTLLLCKPKRRSRKVKRN